MMELWWSCDRVLKEFDMEFDLSREWSGVVTEFVTELWWSPKWDMTRIYNVHMYPMRLGISMGLANPCGSWVWVSLGYRYGSRLWDLQRKPYPHCRWWVSVTSCVTVHDSDTNAHDTLMLLIPCLFLKRSPSMRRWLVASGVIFDHFMNGFFVLHQFNVFSQWIGELDLLVTHPFLNGLPSTRHRLVASGVLFLSILTVSWTASSFFTNWMFSLQWIGELDLLVTHPFLNGLPSTRCHLVALGVLFYDTSTVSWMVALFFASSMFSPQ